MQTCTREFDVCVAPRVIFGDDVHITEEESLQYEIETQKTLAKLTIPATEAHIGENFWTRIERISSVNDLAKMFSSYSPDQATSLISEIHVSSEAISSGDWSALAGLLNRFETLDEFEFREWAVTGAQMSSFLSYVGVNDSQRPKVTTLGITGSQVDSNLTHVLHDVMYSRQVQCLNMEDSVGVENFLIGLLECVNKHEVKELDNLQLNISHCDMENLSSLGKVVDIFPIADLIMAGCELNTEKLQSLQKTLTNSEIENLDVSFNPELSIDDIKILPSLLTKKTVVQSVTMSECCLTDEEIYGFQDKVFSGLHINLLDISYNPTLGLSGLRGLGVTTKSLHLRELSLAGCELKQEHVEELRDSLNGYKLSKLDLSDNSCIGETVITLARLLNECSTKYLRVSDCKLTSKQIGRLSSNLKPATLEEIDISDADRHVDMTYTRATCQLISRVQRKIIACFASLEEECVRELQNCLNTSRNNDVCIVYGRSREVKDVGYLQLISHINEKTLKKIHHVDTSVPSM